MFYLVTNFTTEICFKSENQHTFTEINTTNNVVQLDDKPFLLNLRRIRLEKMFSSSFVFSICRSPHQGYLHRVLGLCTVLSFFINHKNALHSGHLSPCPFSPSLSLYLIPPVPIPTCPQSTHKIYSIFSSQYRAMCPYQSLSGTGSLCHKTKFNLQSILPVRYVGQWSCEICGSHQPMICLNEAHATQSFEPETK